MMNNCCVFSPSFKYYKLVINSLNNKMNWAHCSNAIQINSEHMENGSFDIFFAIHFFRFFLFVWDEKMLTFGTTAENRRSSNCGFFLKFKKIVIEIRRVILAILIGSVDFCLDSTSFVHCIHTALNEYRQPITKSNKFKLNKSA